MLDSRFSALTPLAVDGGPLLGATIFACAAGVNVLLALFVYPRLDKPLRVTFTRPLAQPVRHPNGAVQTHEVVPALDPEFDRSGNSRSRRCSSFPRGSSGSCCWSLRSCWASSACLRAETLVAA